MKGSHLDVVETLSEEEGGVRERGGRDICNTQSSALFFALRKLQHRGVKNVEKGALKHCSRENG